MTNPAIGWCYKDKEGILDLHTLSPTRRGTQVNYLYAVRKVLVTNNWSDEVIDQVATGNLDHAGGAIVQVLVEESSVRTS